MAKYYNPKKQTWKEVKNLGWLLRNWKQVDSFNIAPIVGKQDGMQWDVLMTAYLRDGRIFETKWASRKVCAEWLHRPIFRGLPVFWIDHWSKC